MSRTPVSRQPVSCMYFVELNKQITSGLTFSIDEEDFGYKTVTEGLSECTVESSLAQE